MTEIHKNARWFAWLQFAAATLGLIGLMVGDSVAGWISAAIAASWIVAVMLLVSAYWGGRFVITVLSNPWRARGIIVLMWLFWLVMLFGDQVRRLPPLELYLPYAFFWAWLVVGYLVFATPMHHSYTLVRVVLQIASSVVIVVVVLEILLRVFALHISESITANFTGYEVESTETLMPLQVPIRNYWWANTTNDYMEDQKHLDLYVFTCLKYPGEANNPDGPPYHVYTTYDQYGFRGDFEGDVDVVVIGDSFTHAGRITEPFWYHIAPRVYSLGAATSGNIEQTLNLEAVGLKRHPKVVVLAFFEGNDMQDNWGWKTLVESGFNAQDAEKRSVFEVNAHLRPLRFLWTYALGIWAYKELNVKELVSEPCIYPVEDAYGNQLTFYPEYLSQATVPTDTLRNSAFLQITRDALAHTAQVTKEAGATFVVMFIPMKAHAYWPGLVESGAVEKISHEFSAFKVDNGFFEPDPTITDPKVIEQLILENIDNQRTVLREIAEEEGFLFLDLTPYLQEGAKRGEMYYFYGDTHFNRRGHEYAGEILRQFLLDNHLLDE